MYWRRFCDNKTLKISSVPKNILHNIIRCMVDLLVERFTLYPNDDQKKEFAGEAILVFPFLKNAATDDETVILEFPKHDLIFIIFNVWLFLL